MYKKVKSMISGPGQLAPALRLQNVSKRFGGVKALDAVSFEVAPGEVHCLARRKRLRKKHYDQNCHRRLHARDRC